MERIEERLIALKGRFVAVLFKDNNIMGMLFHDERYGKINLTIPYQSVLYHGFKRNKVYRLQADLQGVTKQLASGKTFTKNNLIVKKVLQ